MNDVLDDVSSNNDVIARLRSALDELTASAGDDGVPLRTPATMAPARWMAVAAAAVLVVGGVAAVAVNSGNQGEPVATPPTTAAPITLPATTEPTLIRVETPFFTIVSPDLVPGERTFEQCCRADPQLVMAWFSGASYLTLTEFPVGPVVDVFPGSDSTVREMETATVLFRSVGLSAAERDALATQVVAGSGLPYVLPVAGWGLAAMGATEGEGRLLQQYTPAVTDPVSSYLPTVTLSVGEYRGELDWLARWPDPQPVVVAGYEGWKVTEADGTVRVFWSAGEGNWATLHIDSTLADRADGLIAAISEIDPTELVVDTVPAPIESDGLSVGDALPGELQSVASGGPTLFVFVSPSCVPCDDAIQDLVATQAPEGSQVPQLALVLLEPSDDAGVDDWLADVGWTGIVIRDLNGVIGARFGIDTVPSYLFVTVDSKGVILDVIAGLFTSGTLDELGIE